MNGVVVRSDRGNLTVTFGLSAFITDWDWARKAFVAEISESFRDVLNPGPGDFSGEPSSDLGEAWCKFRIFGGTSTIILRADALTLTFTNVAGTDEPIIIQVVRTTMERLLPRLQCYERQSYLVNSNYHTHIVEGDSGDYLEEHGSKVIKEAAEAATTAEYRPTVGFTLRSDDGRRVFRRTIEQSEALQNGLFVSDHTWVSLPGLTRFEEELSWRERTIEIANRAAGITHKGNEDDDGSVD